MGFFDLFKEKKDSVEPSAQPSQSPSEVKPEVVAQSEVQSDVAESQHEESAPAQAVETQPAQEQPSVEEDSLQEQQLRSEELSAGLEKTKAGFFSKLARAIAGRSTVDADVLDDLEEVLITSDVGVETTVKIINRIEARIARDKYMNTSELNSILRDEIASLMEESHSSTKDMGLEVKPGMPYVMMVVGVNGAGKTTTIGKLAAQLK